jgi:hypothetical protein
MLLYVGDWKQRFNASTAVHSGIYNQEHIQVNITGALCQQHIERYNLLMAADTSLGRPGNIARLPRIGQMEWMISESSDNQRRSGNPTLKNSRW